MFEEGGKKITLIDMQAGESGTVAEVVGGYGIHRRLESLGVRVGKRIRKVSSMVMRGPVVVEIDNTRVAIGYGMASRIMIEVDRK